MIRKLVLTLLSWHWSPVQGHMSKPCGETALLKDAMGFQRWVVSSLPCCYYLLSPSWPGVSYVANVTGIDCYSPVFTTGCLWAAVTPASGDLPDFAPAT